MLKLISRHLFSNAAQTNHLSVDAACPGNFLWVFWPLKNSGFACLRSNCADFIALSTCFAVAGYSEIFRRVCVNKNVDIKIGEFLVTHHFHFVFLSTSGSTCLMRSRLSLMSHLTRQRCFMLTNPDRFTICPATTCILSAHAAALTFPFYYCCCGHQKGGCKLGWNLLVS